MNSRSSEPYFLPYQTAWHRDPARLRICQKSRQIGLSYVDSYDSVCKAAVADGRDVWVMSRDEAQAKQYIRYCKRWAGILQCAAEDAGQSVFASAKGKPATVQVLSFASGFSIYALSSNPDAIVGKTGHVKLDEFALHKDQRTLYAVAKPVIQWGGTLSIISTHRGIGTVFNEIITDIRERGNRMGWSLHTIPIQAAVEQGLVERINARNASRHRSTTTQPSSASARSTAESPTRDQWLAQQRAECIDEEQWLQEYCCIPADESSAFISYDLITACEDPNLRLLSFDELLACLDSNTSSPATPPLPSDGRGVRGEGVSSLVTRHSSLFLGVDVARKKDLCVLDLGEQIGDVVWDRLRIEFLNRPFAEIEDALYRLLRLRQVKRACIDASGLGAQLAERAEEKFGYKVEPIVFTPRVKEELAVRFKVELEKRQVRVADDDKLRADLRGIRKEVSLSGNARYAGESGDSHCDRFWAKALRQYAARQKPCTGSLVA